LCARETYLDQHEIIRSEDWSEFASAAYTIDGLERTAEREGLIVRYDGVKLSVEKVG
jgi:hypothetical protein